MDNNSLQINKAAAVEFLEMVVAGQIEEAYSKHVDMRGKHHNLWNQENFQALKQGMADNDAQFPAKQIHIKHVIGEGDMVAVHSHLQMKAGDTGMVVLHMFRFENGKIVEMWDMGQEIPAESPNQLGAF